MARFWPVNTARLFSSEYHGSDLFINSVGYDDFTEPTLAPFYPLRTYNSYTLHFVFGGKGTLIVGGNEYTVEKFSLFFTPPKQPMAYYPHRDDPWEYAFFNFGGTQAPLLLQAIGLSTERPVQQDVPPDAVCRLFSELLLTLQNTETQPYYRALSAFYELIHLCSHQALPKGAAAARDLIDTHYASPNFTIDQLCLDLHISHSQLCRLFKASYHTTAVRYLIDRRLTQARRLLTETSLSVKAVAFSCGFSDELHFMKSFKAATGMTAREYRLKQL